METTATLISLYFIGKASGNSVIYSIVLRISKANYLPKPFRLELYHKTFSLMSKLASSHITFLHFIDPAQFCP